MRKALFILKIIGSALFTVCILGICYLMFLSPKKKRFNHASHFQGSYFSQKMLDILVFQDSDFSDVYFEISVPFNKRGDYAEGFKSLNKAVELNPKIYLGYRGWLKLHKIRDFQGCIDDLKMLDALTPNFVDAPWGDNIHYLLGLSFKGLKKYDFALMEFDKSIITEKDSSWVNASVFLHKGIIYNELKDYDNAIKNFDACLVINRNNSSEAYFHKGIAFKRINQIDSAKVCFKKSQELFSKGHKISDFYNEVQDELYLADILEELKYFDEQD